MEDRAILFKTDAGKQEIKDRAQKLPAALRSILLMVDGQRDEPQLRELMSGLRAPDDAIEQLIVKGLVQRGAAENSVAQAAAAPAKLTLGDMESVTAALADSGRYRRLYTILTDTVGRHLGLKGYFMQLKIERCADAEALLALLPEIATALTKAKDHTFASEWLARTRAEARA